MFGYSIKAALIVFIFGANALGLDEDKLAIFEKPNKEIVFEYDDAIEEKDLKGEHVVFVSPSTMCFNDTKGNKIEKHSWNFSISEELHSSKSIEFEVNKKYDYVLLLRFSHDNMKGPGLGKHKFKLKNTSTYRSIVPTTKTSDLIRSEDYSKTELDDLNLKCLEEWITITKEHNLVIKIILQRVISLASETVSDI